MSHEPQTGPILGKEEKKQLVLGFMENVLEGGQHELAPRYMSPNYKQHSARVPDGPSGLLDSFKTLKERFPQFKSYHKHVLVDGDYVVVHSHVILKPGTRGEAVIDIFRLEGDKLAEHWDVIQAVPERSRNDNSMF